MSLQKRYSTVTVLSYQIKCQRGSHNGDGRTDTYLTAFEPRSLKNSHHAFVVGYSGAPTRAKRASTEPHTHRLFSTSFPLVVT